MYQTKEKFNSLFGKDDLVILGLESSCDETAAAISCGRQIISSVVASQIEIHQRFGGVVPEIASRNHTLAFSGVIDSALKQANITLSDIDAIAVTSRPGLIGSLLVGVATAKALSFAKNIPLISVDHIQAHICANYIDTDLAPLFLCLVASGGHTSIIEVKGYNEYNLVAKTADDAIGEAFDKVARLLGLPYPGGPNVDKLSKQGDKFAIDFIKNKGVRQDYGLSYSGIKTAVVNYLHKKEQKGQPVNIPDVCASFTRQAVDMLVNTLLMAASDLGHHTIAIAGGVAANSYLRSSLLSRADGRKIIIPPISLCTDNAAMVAIRGYLSAKEGKNFAGLDLNAASVV